MNLEEKDLAYIWHPCSQMKDYESFPPIVIERGAGIYLYDIHGNEYIDVISSWWCNLLGHNHPKINEAIKMQVDTVEHVILANFSHRPVIALGEALSRIVPEGLTKFHFSDCGSASVECALKMAFQYQRQTGHPEKKRFMCLSGGYHGETIGALAVGAMDLYASLYRPLLMDTIRIEAPDCYRCPFHRHRDDCRAECFIKAEKAFSAYASETAAVIVEPIVQGSAGMRIYPPVYLNKLRSLCDETGVLLIADEIATGFGRTGKMFACDHPKITPDIMCMSKGLTGGYLPMAVTAATENIYKAFYADYREGKALMHSHTYSGNPLGCAAALAVEKVLREENILEKAALTGAYLHEKLSARLIAHPNIGEIRHIGLINAMELVTDKKSKTGFPEEKRIGYEIYQKALRHGLILRPLGNVLYFNPPLTITEDEIDEAIYRCAAAVEEVL